LRDPEARTISAILHAIRDPSFIGKEHITSPNFQDIINEPSLMKLFANTQTSYLSAEIEEEISWLKKIPDFKFSSDQIFQENISIDRALDYAKTLDFVGFVENFENDSGILFDRLQLHRPSFPKLLNVANNKNLSEGLGRKELAIIKKANELDNELYVKVLEIKKNNPNKSHHFFEKEKFSSNIKAFQSELTNRKKQVSSLLPPFKGSGFHELEMDGEGNLFRWTGPYTISNILIDLYPKKNILHIQYNLYPSYAATKVTFYIDGDYVGESLATDTDSETQEMLFRLPDTCNSFYQLKFVVDRVSKPTEQDLRKLGFLIKSINILTPAELKWRKFYNKYIRFLARTLLALFRL
jgi:hypothetical protein